MILWINGPFGVGKTQVAYELHRRLPHSFVCDPEFLGFALRGMWPPELRGDFQDDPVWREGTRRTLERLAGVWCGPVVVPMALVDVEHHREIVGALREHGTPVHHVTLLASRATVLHRIRRRGQGRKSRAARLYTASFDVLAQPAFAEHVTTDGRSVEQVAEDTAASAGLVLGARAGSRAASLARRVWAQWARHRYELRRLVGAP